MKSWGQLLEEPYSTELIQLPAKNRPSPGADKSNYCWYHQVLGHNTEDFTTLKDKIERLIQKRHMQKFVKDLSRDKECKREWDWSRECNRNYVAVETQL